MGFEDSDILNYLLDNSSLKNTNSTHLIFPVTSRNNVFKSLNENENILDLDKETDCKLVTAYYDIEAYCYLFIMCPMAFIGIILNLISLRVFRDKSFNTVTFKYLRLITLTDFFICIIIIPYCITSYTQPFNKYDLYIRHFYLAYLYIPGANFAINLSMFLNLLVTIERLISVGWPTQKYTLFKPSRYYLSCFLVLFLAILANVANFFLFKIELCKSELKPRSFTMEKWWAVYGYVKEVLTRVLPIVLLILFNILLIYIVKSSRKKMQESVSISYSTKVTKSSTKQLQSYCSCLPLICADKKYSTELIESKNQLIRAQTTKRTRQENQLTWMTIFVAILYSASSIPMVFAYPGLIFTAEQTQTKMYKMYAVLVNILELLQCSFRFLVYFCFTTQFRQVFFRMYALQKKSPVNTEMNNVNE